MYDHAHTAASAYTAETLTHFLVTGKCYLSLVTDLKGAELSALLGFVLCEAFGALLYHQPKCLINHSFGAWVIWVSVCLWHIC